MTEEKLKAFVENPENKEGQTLEYKLKPNFCEIKETFDHIKDRVHFKILKTIYAFANTKGGELYIGVGDKKEIIGIDSFDKKIVEDTILKKV